MIVLVVIAIAALVAYQAGAASDRRRRARRVLDAYVTAELKAHRGRLAVLEAAAAPSSAPGTLEPVYARANELLRTHR